MKLPRTPTFLPEIDTYHTLIKVSGGTIKIESLQALDRFVRDCYNAGIWSKLLEIYPFCGDTLTAALAKLKNYAISPALTAVNLVAADYTERGANGGVAGDGAAKYLNSNFLQSQLLPTSAHLSVYLREAETSSPRMWFGANTGTDWSSLRSATGTQSQAILGGNSVAIAPATLAPGLYASNRSATNQMDMYYNGANAGSNTTNATINYGNANLFLLARNNNNISPADYTPKRISFASIGLTMTAAEHAALYSAVQALQTNLGRAV